MEGYEHKFMGVHVFGEMYGISSEDLDNMELLEKALTHGIEGSGATLCSLQKKQFSPSGVTLLALLSESHASIHTYPDKGALFFDAFTCGDQCKPQQIAKSLETALKPSRVELKVIQRGDIADLQAPILAASAAELRA